MNYDLGFTIGNVSIEQRTIESNLTVNYSYFSNMFSHLIDHLSIEAKTLLSKICNEKRIYFESIQTVEELRQFFECIITENKSAEEIKAEQFFN